MRRHPVTPGMAAIRRGEWDGILDYLCFPFTQSPEINGYDDFDVCPIPHYLAVELLARRRHLLRGGK